MVEKDLAKENKTRHEIGREELVKRIWQWKEEKGSHIIEQLKQLGCSCDWSREWFTMDENLSESVQKVFLHLYQKNLIYKGKYIINWCPRCVTALANDEVEYEDKKGKLWYGGMLVRANQ
jgi:valyl-tRNA synthetase